MFSALTIIGVAHQPQHAAHKYYKPNNEHGLGAQTHTERMFAVLKQVLVNHIK
jgi:hypothetical protein